MAITIPRGAIDKLRNNKNPAPAKKTPTSGLANAAKLAADKIKQAAPKSNFDKVFNDYKGRLNSPSQPTPSNNNNLRDYADTVSRTARDAANLRSQERQQQFDQQRRLVEDQSYRQRQQQNDQVRFNEGQQVKQQWDNYYAQEENKRQQFNAQQRADTAAKQQRDFQNSLIRQQSTANARAVGGTFATLEGKPRAAVQAEFDAKQATINADEEAKRLKLRDEANTDADKAIGRQTEAQSRLQRERSDQGLAAQRAAAEAAATSQQRNIDAQERSQSAGIEGNSRLQRERTEQTSKLQTQAAAEAASRTASNRQAAIDSFRKFGKGKGV